MKPYGSTGQDPAVKLLTSVLLCLQEGKSWRRTQGSYAVVVEATNTMKCVDKIRTKCAINRNPLVFFWLKQHVNEKQRHKHDNRALERKLRNKTACSPGWEKTICSIQQSKQDNINMPHCSWSHLYPYLPQRQTHMAFKISADACLHENKCASMGTTQIFSDCVLQWNRPMMYCVYKCAPPNLSLVSTRERQTPMWPLNDDIIKTRKTSVSLYYFYLLTNTVLTFLIMPSFPVDSLLM